MVFLGIAVVVAAVTMGASYVIAGEDPDPDRNAADRCGYDPFGDSLGKFDVRFYLIAILFIIFDLEVAFLFPWAVSLGDIGVFGF